jgi:transcriptional accessory protein Tex/SPT6
MAITVTIDLRHVARGIGVPLRQIQTVVELLDEGNTVPFITRYRKDQTGGLDEEQIRQIQVRLTKLRLLADRKQTILRSIEAQGKLTEDLAALIHAATTTKRLEDLYLPFKPKKQTLATFARGRGLEDLAREILAADPICADLDARARDFANPDRQVPTGADALLGAGHILAEQFSEQAELRQRLREIIQQTGRFVSAQTIADQKAEKAEAERAETEKAEAEKAEQKAPAEAPVKATTEAPVETTADTTLVATEPIAAGRQPTPIAAESTTAAANSDTTISDEPPATFESPSAAFVAEENVQVPPDPASDAPSTLPFTDPPSDEPAGTEPIAVEQPATEPPPAEQSPVAAAPRAAAAAKRTRAQERAERLNQKELKKKRIEEKRIKAFRGYFNYTEEIRKIPPHRILAINRGERARVLRVKIESDLPALHAVLDEMLVPPGHPHAEYLRGCARDALTRLILPSLEREVRRELTDRAEAHAVGVFAKNLRNLLLQPPVRDRRLLAIDPGFKSGCKLVALDQFGNVLEHGMIFLVGKSDRQGQAKQKVVDMLNRLQLSVIVIGNGTACRQTEDFIAELLDNELKGRGVAYVIVNEAGASVYSTSRIGREEFPQHDATLRGAISIGRRLQDPLSELVKIDPANIGVGLYQHDVKAKHLRASLDEVVESCVNYVGVDVNTASPALLRYVSGLNQLTARRVYEYRSQHGPFQSREQLHEVSGFGEAAFVQAAGFLKITGGSNPLDATWIHPESYEAANRLLAKLECKPSDLTDNTAAAALAQRVATVDREAQAKELGIGTLTLNDILAQLARPGRDPREDLPQPVFKQGVLKLEDLAPGMELTGTVLNVVDFGAFVDIGMHDSGLVHVSHLADKYVRDPHEMVAVGDIVKVWVLEVDKERRRVSLTMVQPGSERQRHPRHDEKHEGQPPAAPEGGKPRGGERRPPRGPRPADRPPAGKPSDQPPREARPPRPKGPPQYKGPPPHKGPPKPRYQPPKPRPKPLIPITDGMKSGKEPMRTFGDLMQFYSAKDKQKSEGEEKKQGQKDQAERKPQQAQPLQTVEQPPAAVEQSPLPIEQPPPVEQPLLAVEQPPPALEKPPPAVEQSPPENEQQPPQSDAAQPFEP